MPVNSKNHKALWLSGNEAIALGAYEAGVQVASGYPGTPSTEILENFTRYDDVYAEWAPNEKVALEVALGACFAGSRALATMKHVGLNVAADPLFTASYTGVKGGLVIVCADDPGMHSSQNEQDNRNYAFASKLPMLEPSDPAEAKEFMKIAYDLSERYDTPVLLRTTTRISHVKGVVPAGVKVNRPSPEKLEKQPAKFVMLPANAMRRRHAIAARMVELQDFAENFEYNRIDPGTDTRRGFITSSVAYLYVKEVFPEAPVLKLSMCWPLPEKKIRQFAAEVDELIIVEELDPFLENHVKAMGIACKGKEIIAAIGELNPIDIRKAFDKETRSTGFAPLELIPRPPNMCAGCPHRGLFYNLSRLKLFVSGDIGCYTLGFLPPLSAMDSCVCMGASIGIAHGMEKALKENAPGKTVAVIGDSTFLHSGITGLINTVYNQGISTVIILDNRITGMTGHQHNPASGCTLNGNPTIAIDLENLCRAIGVEHVTTINPHDIPASFTAIKGAVESTEPSVIISRYPCILIPEEKSRKKDLYAIATTACNGCTACLRIGCPAIHWHKVTAEEAATLGLPREKQPGYAVISESCGGCGQCVTLCKHQAIARKEGE